MKKAPCKEGLEVTYRQLLSALEHNGMKCENPVGLKFDPNTMQAITMVKDPAVQPGCVATVFQRGWKIADRVLRRRWWQSRSKTCFFRKRLNIET